MDMSHLPPAIAADCDKTGNFAKDVWKCRKDGSTIEAVMEMVVNFKSNNTSLLEELVHELYAMPIDSSANIYNVGFNKLYNALDLTDADNPRFTGGEKGILNSITHTTLTARIGGRVKRNCARLPKGMLKRVPIMPKNRTLVDILAGAKTLAEGLNGQLAEITCFPYDSMNAIQGRLVDGRMIWVQQTAVKTKGGGWLLAASIESTTEKYRYNPENPESAERFIKHKKQWKVKVGDKLPMDRVIDFLNTWVVGE